MASEVDRLLQPAEVVDPRVGMTLSGRYELLSRIGDGGMGSVYEARHLVIEKTVAVKILRADLATNAEQVARFRREATAAAAIGHRNIIDVHDMGRADDGAVFMVMERLRGEDWAEVLERTAPSLPEIVAVLDQVLDGLGAAHAAGVLHRDLKPANVFVCEDGTVKLLDFGVSKVLAGTQLSTSTGVTMGTPVFMSPEQVRDSKHVDHRTDLYAVGVMLFYALSGRYPFEASSIAGIAYKIVAEPPPSIHTLVDGVPDWVEALLAKLLAKDPDDRLSTCEEVRDALRAGLGDVSVPGLAGTALADTGLADTVAATPSLTPPAARAAPRTPVITRRSPKQPPDENATAPPGEAGHPAPAPARLGDAARSERPAIDLDTPTVTSASARRARPEAPPRRWPLALAAAAAAVALAGGVYALGRDNAAPTPEATPEAPLEPPAQPDPEVARGLDPPADEAPAASGERPSPPAGDDARVGPADPERPRPAVGRHRGDPPADPPDTSPAADVEAAPTEAPVDAPAADAPTTDEPPPAREDDFASRGFR